MKFQLLTIAQVCDRLCWGTTKFYERRAAGLFPRPVNISGGKKGNIYFSEEVDFYISRAIFLNSESDFISLAREIEMRREDLKNVA
jgi:predicted DNA-binding transcriptional regulator AlpA